jgi:hypothetical protein
MRRILLFSVTLIALVWTAGCGSNSGSIGSSGTTLSPALLNGQYAFVLSGYDPSQNPIGMAGSVKADGQGHITAGEVDVNDGGVVSTNSALIGSYSFDPNGGGTLGTIILTNTVGSVTHPLEFDFALNSTGTFGDIMDISANNFFIAGTLQQQTASAFTLANMAGSYVITINGRNSSSPTSEVGSFTIGSTGGAATNTSFDRSISGTAIGNAGPTTGNSATVTFPPANGPDVNGRGLFTVFLSDGLTTSATTENFVYYVVGANRFIAVETDATGAMTADASRQGTLTSTSDATTGAVFGISGYDTSNSSEVAAIGQIQISGATATLGWDSNDNGSNGLIASIASLPGQAVTFNSATGRGTITVTNGVANGLANNLVFYLTAPGAGFVMDATSGTANRAMAGPLTAQTSTSFSTAADFPGLAILRARGVALTDAQSFVGEFGLTTTAGIYAFLADERSPSLGIEPDQAISPITAGTISATGRGTLNNGSEALVVYVIGPNQFVMLDVTSGSGSGSSPVFFANPD